MRVFVAFLLLAGSTLSPAFADPTSDVAANMLAFSATKSFHVDMTAQGRTMSIDLVAPDRVHTKITPGDMEMIAIGSDGWFRMNGSWQKMPAANTQLGTGMQNLRTGGLQGTVSKNYTVADLGPDTVGTTPAHHYRLTKISDKSVVDMWFGNDRLPLQIQTNDPKAGPSTITYSEYNSVPDITPPM